MAKSKLSEYRLYGFILDRLEEIGWRKKSPSRGGQVYTQNEALQDEKLKIALKLRRPENVVKIGENQFWVIEAKADVRASDEAFAQACERAAEINSVAGISCPLVTSVVGEEDSTHYVKTYCLVKNEWKLLLINGREATGFISPSQVSQLLRSGNGRLDEYEIDDRVFSQNIKKINMILHNGAFHKKNRADVLACLLLALANDPRMPISTVPTTLIQDINTRAAQELVNHGKGSFYNEISINKPTSPDNHTKNRNALAQSIEILRGLNIVSTINSGRDVLGQCYEQFLKYANDASEIGIVLTPRHITNFGAEIVDIKTNDIVFDPTCGTGGFLVSALDKVRRDSGDIEKFKKGNLHGVEQDAGIATLAIVNMVFRGDGSSNIKEGNCLKTSPKVSVDKVLMNPPFAIEDPEWRFVDEAIRHMKPGALLFAVIPTTTMSSGDDSRGEITWRKNMLANHTLLSVIKMPENLFYPNVSKGTYGVVIQAHRPHKLREDKVVWAILHDGVIHSKTQKAGRDNLKTIQSAVKSFVIGKTVPSYIPAELDCSIIKSSAMPAGIMDLSPEEHIGSSRKSGIYDIASTLRSNKKGNSLLKEGAYTPAKVSKCGVFPVVSFFSECGRGASGRSKTLPQGNLPLISTSENNNGISAFVDEREAKKIYPSGNITISANGAACSAFYHDYPFAANSDVYVCKLKREYNKRDFIVFLCSAINAESWRFNYYRKFTSEHLKKLKVKIPTIDGEVNFALISSEVKRAGK